jgi:L-seryl-tRNA(Ser) seleniumtransferase
MPETTILDRLNVKRIINAAGPETHLGGSVLEPEVVAAMAEASRIFLDIRELLAKAGNYIAKTLRVEAALVTSGCAAALLLAAAACITGKDPAKMARLPDTEGMKREVVIQHAHRNPFDQAFRAAGARLITVGRPWALEPWEIESAISRDTAAVAYNLAGGGPLSLREVAEVAHRHQVPVIVDAANAVPPLQNLTRLVEEGADLVAVSGGKGIRGPNDTGILLGRKDLVEAAAMQASPNFGIGRTLKVSKEAIVGLVKAVELAASRDLKAEIARWTKALQTIKDRLKDIRHIKAEIVVPDEIGRPVPRLHIKLHVDSLGLTAQAVIEALKHGEPAIHTVEWLTQLYHPDTIIIEPTTLSPGEEQVVAERIAAVLSSPT